MRELLDAADFIGRTRRKLRFGDFSREPLLLLRFEWRGETVECDWLMRAPDPWDKDLPEHAASEHQTLQALRDALRLRDAIFCSFATVSHADLQMFRTDAEHRLELVMTGSTSRTDEELYRVPSVAMRARMCGFRFNMVGGELESIATPPMSCS